MLKNIEFNAYILNTIAFARTIVIKCEELALLDNKQLQQYYGINAGTDKSKWKYYLNLNGEYHELDDEMEVQSLDNGEIIKFTKANLDIHLATKRAYRLGSYYYTRLVEKYQHQLILINGIINPIPPSESIPANNYQILRYNTDYVLWNEYQLIPALQKHIDTIVLGSFKTEYLYTDNLMLPALLAQLHGSLVTAILSIRKEADGTRYAHDFYIWSRLQSYGISSIYKPVLNRKQTMWLYRNIEYVLRLLGRRHTFDEVMDIVLTERNIPLTSYETLQTTESMIEDLAPNPQMLSRPINMLRVMGTDTKLWNVDEVITKELPLALDNEANADYAISDTEYAIKYSLHSSVPSKVLESNLTDTTDRNPDRIMRVLHNHWIYFVYNQIYTINVDVTDARTGKVMRLTTADALILWHYLLDRSRGIKFPGDIPEYNYWHVRKINGPTYQELMQLGHKEILTETVCRNILDVHIDFPTLVSPDSFFQKSQEIANGIWSHKKLYSRINNLFTAARRYNAVEACYENGLAKIGDYTTYEKFLLKMDLDFYDYTEEECLDLAWAIWSKVTGWDQNSFVSVGEQQRLLINLMKDLTSYTVQYIGSTETAEGQFNLPYMMLLDGDYWLPDGETALESDDNRVFLPNLMKGKPDCELEAKELKGGTEDPPNGRVDAISIGCGRLYAPMHLKPIEVDPDVNNVQLRIAMTLKSAPAPATLDPVVGFQTVLTGDVRYTVMAKQSVVFYDKEEDGQTESTLPR